MSPGALLLLAAVGLATSIGIGPRFPRAWLGLVLGGLAATLAASALVLGGEPEWNWRSGFAVGGEYLHLRLDALSAWFLALVSVIGGTGAVYAGEYWPESEHPQSAPRGRAWWSGLLLSLVAVLLSSNGLHFLVAWELFTVGAFFLITLDRSHREVRAAGWLYLAASHVGMVFLFGFFATLAARTGSWEFGPALRGQAALAPLFWLMLAGFGVKAGIFPLHVWLPSAHANAPSHVSAIMSGVAIKMGIYGILRFTGWLPMPAPAGAVVLGLGAVGAVVGIAFAFAQNDLKRLLAYCSVENIGIVCVGLGGALLGAAHAGTMWGQLLLAGALLHIWNHGLFKSLLFLGAGSVLHATGTREMSRLGGLWRSMPWTAGMFALGAVALAGLPPLNGFVSEWLVYLGLFDAVAHRGPTAWAAAPAALSLAVAGALALASFVKVSAVVFLGSARTRAARHGHDAGPAMRGAMLTLVAGCLAIAVAPAVLWPALARVMVVWNPAWNPALPVAPLAVLGRAQAALALVLIVAVLWLWSRVRANGLRRALTWDCGFAAPTPRMQYTSGSFAAIGSGWFFWMLRPERKTRRPRGTFPGTARRLERVPETVLELLVTPASRLVLRVSTAVRQLQHGRLQSYIVYVLAGLVALAAFVVIGGLQ